MQRIVIVVAAITVGTMLLWFRKEFAVFCIKDQNRLWRFRFGERTIWLTEVVVVVVALCMITAGLLCLMGVGRVR